jgi:tocopherol O-methyltransferase
MISCPSVTRRSIRAHYELSTLFYRLLWGRHIHHGLWTADESPAAAQRNLIEELARCAAIRCGDVVLDVGCGMGGSAIHLAGAAGCQVTGVTLSSVQRAWAAAAALAAGVSSHTTFRRADAESIEFAPASFDVVWSVECTEHLFDKPRFFQRVAQWLRPGGRLAICAWLAGEEPRKGSAQCVQQVCEGFLCPSLGTMQDYRGWMTEAGLKVTAALDWTERTWQTWEICRRRVQSSRVRWLARLVDRDTTRFLDRFPAILQAFQSRAMQYGCLVAQRR